MYNLINKETGLKEFTGTYEECLNKRTLLIKEDGGVTSRPDDYFLIVPVNTTITFA